MDRLQRNTLHIELLSSPEEDKMRQFVTDYDVIAGGWTVSNNVAVKFRRKIDFKNGKKSLAKKLGLDSNDVKIIQEYKNLPDDYLIDYMGGCFVPEKFKMRFGEMLNDDYMKMLSKTTVENLKNRKRMKIIKKHTIGELEDLGLINEHNRYKIVNLKEAIEREVKEQNVNPDLDGHFEWTFVHHNVNCNDLCAYASGEYPEVKVTIKGFPNNLEVKKKCWWIHSDVSGFGKTFFLEEFCKKFNAQIMTTSTNVTDISRNTQWLLFDETTDIPNFEGFKKLTSGVCYYSFNKKMFGANFIPRKDVQIIVCANVSPYEFFGKYDNKLQRKMMSLENVTQLEQRVNYVKLDGEAELTKRKFMSVCDWTENEFREEIKIKRNKMIKGEDRLIETENLLRKVATMYRMRAGETGVSLVGFQKYVSDPDDWKVAQWMYSRRLKLIPEDKRKDFNKFLLSDEPEYVLEDVSQFEDIENALLRDKSLQIVHLFDFLDLDVTDFDPSEFKKLCEKKFIDVDSNELLCVVIKCLMGVRKHKNDASSDDEEGEYHHPNKREKKSGFFK